MTSPSPLLVLLAALSLAACGDRDPDDVSADGPAAVGDDASVVGDAPGSGLAPSGASGDVSGEDDGATDGGPSAGAPIATTGDADGTGDDGPDADEDELFDVDATLDEDATLDFDAAPDEDATLDFDATPNDDTTLDFDAAPDEDATLDLDATPDEDVGPVDDAIDTDGESFLVPAVPGDANAARVLDGLRFAVGRTLIDLNERLSGGVDLSAQQDECLGAFDPAFGEPLFAVDCEQPLATEPVALYVERAAFHDTDDCRAGLAAARADDCVIAYASVFTRTVFVQTPPDRRPRPLPGSGIVVRYAIDGPVLEVASDADALTGAFSCRIDLATGTTLPSTVGDCDTALRDVATRFDELFADVR